MTSQDTALSLSGGDPPVGLEALSSLAVRVLNEHTNQAGRRAACRSAWPREQASLAEHNLAAL
ncbi:MAG: hypothetical protein ACRDSR_24795 [Pseudonocardiaceae bacterium]